MNKVVLNLVIDEKFVDGIIESQQEFSNGVTHLYAIVRKKPLFTRRKPIFRYIKKFPDRIIILNYLNFFRFLRSEHVDAIILHSMPVLPPFFICRIPKRIKVFWFAWGFDIYTFPKYNPFVSVNLYRPETKLLVEESINPKDGKKRWHGDKFMVINRIFSNYYDAIKRIDYFSGVLEYEYDLVKKYTSFPAARVVYRYENIAKLNTPNVLEKHVGNGIMIGNSGAPENNHVDLLPFLEKVDLKDRKIIMPLSYGNSSYIQSIIEQYKTRFGSQFQPLLSFMSYDEYKKLISSCTIAVFYHMRQQAMGNINLFLSNGCKVFLSKYNPVYDYYKTLGVKLFSIEDELNQREIDSELDLSFAKHNHDILYNRYSYDSFGIIMSDLYNLI